MIIFTFFCTKYLIQSICYKVFDNVEQQLLKSNCYSVMLFNKVYDSLIILLQCSSIILFYNLQHAHSAVPPISKVQAVVSTGAAAIILYSSVIVNIQVLHQQQNKTEPSVCQVLHQYLCLQ